MNIVKYGDSGVSCVKTAEQTET